MVASCAALYFADHVVLVQLLAVVEGAQAVGGIAEGQAAGVMGAGGALAE
jgi:hypothetical protein